MAHKAKRTEHAGAKNGRGFWGTRAEAKSASRKVRREVGKAVIAEEEVRECPVCHQFYHCDCP